MQKRQSNWSLSVLFFKQCTLLSFIVLADSVKLLTRAKPGLK